MGCVSRYGSVVRHHPKLVGPCVVSFVGVVERQCALNFGRSVGKARLLVRHGLDRSACSVGPKKVEMMDWNATKVQDYYRQTRQDCRLLSHDLATRASLFDRGSRVVVDV